MKCVYNKYTFYPFYENMVPESIKVNHNIVINVRRTFD